MLQAAHLACRRGWGVIEVPAEDDQRIPLSRAARAIACCAADACSRCGQAAHHQLSLRLPGGLIGLLSMKSTSDLFFSWEDTRCMMKLFTGDMMWDEALSIPKWKSICT